MKTKSIVIAALVIAGLYLLIRFAPREMSLGGAMVAGFTPEWLAHSSSVVFEGVPLRADAREVMMTGRVTAVQFRVDRVIKGPLSVGDLVTIVSHRHGPGLNDEAFLTSAAARKAQGLVFAAVARHRSPEIDGRYEFVSNYWPGAFFADQPLSRLYDEAGASIPTYDNLRTRVVAQCTKEATLARDQWRGKIAMAELPVGEQTDAFRELNEKGRVTLLAPQYQDR